LDTLTIQPIFPAEGAQMYGASGVSVYRHARSRSHSRALVVGQQRPKSG